MLAFFGGTYPIHLRTWLVSYINNIRYRISPTAAVALLPQEKQMEVLTRWVPGMTALPNKFELVFERRSS